MGKNITQLPAAVAVAGSDLLIVETETGTSKATAAQLRAAPHASLSGLEADDHPQYLTAARADARYVRYATPVQSHGTVATATYVIDTSLAQLHLLTRAAALSALALSFTGWPSDTEVSSTVVLDITGGNGKVTFPTVAWAGGIAPVLTNGMDRLVFEHHGGVTYGFIVAQNVALPA